MTRQRWVTALAALGLVVTPVAAVAVWAAGFGVLTMCTNDYSCSQTSCAPCRAEYVAFNGLLALLFVAFVGSVVLLVGNASTAGRRGGPT